MTKIFSGCQELHHKSTKVSGELVNIDGERFYKIEHVDHMPHFFMSIVSAYDHWLFISSNDGITAGRNSAEKALFPYYTADLIIHDASRTGGYTSIRVHTEEGLQLWRPLSNHYRGIYRVYKNAYKNAAGNRLILEEVNEDLGLVFTVEWTSAKKEGIIRRCALTNTSDRPIKMDILDGLLNVMPAGINPEMQQMRSVLVDGYRHTELDPETGLAMFNLGSKIVDKAEPSESLSSNVVWNAGLKREAVLLSSAQIPVFGAGGMIETEDYVRGQKGAYLVKSTLELAPKQIQEWVTVGDVDLSTAQVANTLYSLKTGEFSFEATIRGIDAGTLALQQLVAMNDGQQRTGDVSAEMRHHNNVLFNVMRGGLFRSGYQVMTKHLRGLVTHYNRSFAQAFDAHFDKEEYTYPKMLEKLDSIDHSGLKRLCTMYLPLSFSRRHGDPSRPWNRFFIQSDADESGSYEGNWRDIFQNWEAMSYSYPYYIFGMIYKFLNSSTADGYNPYRITEEGIDWEVIEPDDEWSYIGYWGDHQIVYLHRLLVHAEKHFPGRLTKTLNERAFTFADVPYRIKGFDDIKLNPKDTIEYDFDVAEAVEERKNAIGEDGAMLTDTTGQIVEATLLEKLMITLLTKLSNYVPNGGIWLNTQRPEWNDANNALVGNGMSVVTVGQMIPYVQTLIELLEEDGTETYSMNAITQEFYQSILSVLDSFEPAEEIMDAQLRATYVEQLGRAGDRYRSRVYETPTLSLTEVNRIDLVSALKCFKAHLTSTLKSNRRDDGLFHSYNLMHWTSEGITIDRLPLMLEGQVSALPSLKKESGELKKSLKGMYESDLYRKDQDSFMLYPNREMPRTLAKNTLLASDVKDIPLIGKMLDKSDHRIIEPDVTGGLHFNAELNNADALRDVLKELEKDGYPIDASSEKLLQIYEQKFNHRAFTGRSTTFFAFEGLGSIYWHMVSKLYLSALETIEELREDESVHELLEIAAHIKRGIGAQKSPDQYGAFPTDPYSHTPAHAGAQQPGMTGQVKEDVLSRWIELGVRVKDGRLSFTPFGLSRKEQLTETIDLKYMDQNRMWKALTIQEGEVGFTYLGIPVVYSEGSVDAISIHFVDGKETKLDDTRLPADLSAACFERKSGIEVIRVTLSGKCWV